MTTQEMRALIDNIACPPYTFQIIDKDGQAFLLASYQEADVVTGDPSLQKTRKWYLSPWATKSEIVQTALKCVLTSMEHRARESFQYRGKRIFGPHFDVDTLHQICADSASLDVRTSL